MARVFSSPKHPTSFSVGTKFLSRAKVAGAWSYLPTFI